MKNIVNYGDGPRAIYEELKEQIITGKLKAGNELKILPMAKEMDVSIVPLREAIRMLAGENLVETRPRRSPIVARIDVREIIEMNKIRGALEPIVLEDAVHRHTEETLEECRALLDEDKKATDPWEKVELNKQFHLTLLSPSNMKRSLSVIADQYDGIARITQYMVVDHTKMVGKANSEHRDIFKAVEERDASLAVALMSDHINEATVRAQNELAPDDGEQD